MNFRLAFCFFLLAMGMFFTHSSQAATYKLLNGRTLTGEAIAPDDRGIIIKTDSTTLSERIGWTNFTEATILELSKDPKFKPHVEPFLFDLNDPEEEERKALAIKPRQVPRMARPDPNAGWAAIFSSPVSLTLILLVYLANIYAGLEIGIFRNFHPILTAGVAAILPLLGPVIFLSMPTNLPKSEEEEYYDEEEFEEESAEAEAVAPEALEEAVPVASAVQEGPPPPTVYRRGQFTINKRFFETKLAAFTKPMPGKDDKDMVICIESARGNYIGNRIARIMPNEMVLLVSKGGASSEVTLPFSEIKEVQIRHKDA
jgi:hypothetical protein